MKPRDGLSINLFTVQDQFRTRETRSFPSCTSDLCLLNVVVSAPVSRALPRCAHLQPDAPCAHLCAQRAPAVPVLRVEEILLPNGEIKAWSRSLSYSSSKCLAWPPSADAPGWAGEAASLPWVVSQLQTRARRSLLATLCFPASEEAVPDLQHNATATSLQPSAGSRFPSCLLGPSHLFVFMPSSRSLFKSFVDFYFLQVTYFQLVAESLAATPRPGSRGEKRLVAETLS